MKRTLKQIVLAVTLAAGVPAFTGCLAVAVAGGAAAGAGAVVYVKGELQATLEAPLTKCVAAANQALTNLKLNKISEESDGISAKLKARNAKDQAVTISLKKLTDSSTHVGIRIGTWGDKLASQELLDEIKKGL